MATRFRHAALVGKFNAEGIREELESVAAFLVAKGLAVTLEEDTAAKTGIDRYPRLPRGRSARRATSPSSSAATARCSASPASWRATTRRWSASTRGGSASSPTSRSAISRAALAPILAGDYDEEKRTMLEGGVERDGATIFASLALNDVIVSRGATAGMVELRIEIDGEFVAHLRADGLIIGSPTGSTAYALSAGGPILHPGIAGWALVPIAPHDLSNRPIVVPDSGEVTIEIVAGRDASVNFDMQSLTSLAHGDRICVRRSADRVRFLHPRGWSYYATLRGKLHWASGV